MPTYQYRCTSCDRELEVVQKFTDDPLTDCPECDGSLRKVFNAVGVVFKGSGFYATDNRTKGKAGAAKSSERSGEKSEKSEKSDSKPAAESAKKSEAKPSSTGATSAA
jgi:putative FmdB family regulatory protein